MTDEGEECAPSDSQESTTSSVISTIHHVFEEHLKNGGEYLIRDFGDIYQEIKSDSNGEEDLSSLGLLQEPSPADSGYNPLSNEASVENACARILPGLLPKPCKFPGSYNFSVVFSDTGEVAKNSPYTYSKSLEKLFVNINVSCPIKFSCLCPPPSCVIRSVIQFSADEYSDQAVCRCCTHLVKDKSDNNGHVLQVIEKYKSTYQKIGDHFTVITPYVYPTSDIGPRLHTVQYRFGCLSSCVGGMNRRPTRLVFILEDDTGSVLGMDYVHLKICCCPGRDKSKEEERTKKRRLIIEEDSQSNKQRRLLPTAGYRAILVKEEDYECISKIVGTLQKYLEKIKKP